MKYQKQFFYDVTISKKGGAPAREAFDFKPLNVTAYLSSARRRTPVENAPSLIAGKLVKPLGVTNDVA